MGWHAQTEWDLTIDVNEIPDLVADMNALMTARGPEGTSAFGREPTRVFASWGDDSDVTVEDVLERLIGAFHEDGELHPTVKAPPGTERWVGWGSGKSWETGADPEWRPLGTTTYNAGGEGVYTLLARYCTGTIDWEDDYLWRIRLHGDGTWATYTGEVTYPDDPIDGGV